MDRLLRLLDSQHTEAGSAPPNHPYSPKNIVLSGYKANDATDIQLLLTFALAWTPIFASTWMAMAWYCPRLKLSDRLTVLWFVLCRCAASL